MGHVLCSFNHLTNALLVEHVFAGQNNTSGSDFEVIEANGAMRLPFRFERLLVHGLSIER